MWLTLGAAELIVILCMLFIPASLVLLGVVVAWMMGKRRASRTHCCPFCRKTFTEAMEVEAAASPSSAAPPPPPQS